MSRPSVDQTPTARVAVVGAETPEGTHVRATLAEMGLPGARIDLYGSTDGEAVLSEYGGEARLIQAPDLTELAEQDVVFVCEDSEIAARLLMPAPEGRSVVINLAGSCAGRDDVPLIHVDIHPEQDALPGVVAVPHALSSALAGLLHPLDRVLGLRRARVVVTCPAADFGPQGLDELREQTVRLFNFSSMPTDLFGRQVAFNVVPFGVLGRDRIERQIAVEIERVLGWPAGRVTIHMILVPIFHGHGFSVELELDGPVDLGKATRSLEDSPDLLRDDDAWTPLDAVGERRTIVPEIIEDGAGGLRLWAISGDVEKVRAEQAVRLADRIVGLGLRQAARLKR